MFVLKKLFLLCFSLALCAPRIDLSEIDQQAIINNLNRCFEDGVIQLPCLRMEAHAIVSDKNGKLTIVPYSSAAAPYIQCCLVSRFCFECWVIVDNGAVVAHPRASHDDPCFGNDGCCTSKYILMHGIPFTMLPSNVGSDDEVRSVECEFTPPESVVPLHALR
jgi:hypothetical protein